jgi:hypothetical protein
MLPIARGTGASRIAGAGAHASRCRRGLSRRQDNLQDLVMFGRFCNRHIRDPGVADLEYLRAALMREVPSWPAQPCRELRAGQPRLRMK